MIFPSVISFRIMQSDSLKKTTPGNNIILQENFDKGKGIFYFWFKRQFHRLSSFFHFSLSISFSLLIFFLETLQLKHRWVGVEFLVSFSWFHFYFMGLNLHWFEQLDWSFSYWCQETKGGKSTERKIIKNRFHFIQNCIDDWLITILYTFKPLHSYYFNL